MLSMTETHKVYRTIFISFFVLELGRPGRISVLWKAQSFEKNIAEVDRDSDRENKIDTNNLGLKTDIGDVKPDQTLSMVLRLLLLQDLHQQPTNSISVKFWKHLIW